MLKLRNCHYLEVWESLKMLLFTVRRFSLYFSSEMASISLILIISSGNSSPEVRSLLIPLLPWVLLDEFPPHKSPRMNGKRWANLVNKPLFWEASRSVKRVLQKTNSEWEKKKKTLIRIQNTARRLQTKQILERPLPMDYKRLKWTKVRKESNTNKRIVGAGIQWIKLQRAQGEKQRRKLKWISNENPKF